MNADTAPGTPISLCAEGLSCRIRGRTILENVHIGLMPGEVVALLGANGAGKSTLIRLLLGLLPPSGGRVHLTGRDLHTFTRKDLARHLAYVPQTHVTPFPYTVREVVQLGRLPHVGLLARPSRRDSDAVDAALERMRLHPLADRPYTEVSGGERQLALIARALAQEARLLILDEPATGLDYGNQVRLLTLLHSLAEEGYGVLQSTHHPDHALQGADRVVVLREGRVDADGPPQDVLTPNRFKALYGVDVSTVVLPDGRHTVVPV